MPHPHHSSVRASNRSKMKAITGKGGAGSAFMGSSSFKRPSSQGVQQSFDGHTKGFDVGKAHGGKSKARADRFARGGRAKHKGDVNISIVQPQTHHPHPAAGLGLGAGAAPPPPAPPPGVGGGMPPPGGGAPGGNPAAAQAALGAIAGGGGPMGAGMPPGMGPGRGPFAKGGRTKMHQGATAGRTMKPGKTLNPHQPMKKAKKPVNPAGGDLGHWAGYAAKNSPGGSQSGEDAGMPLATPTSGKAKGGRAYASGGRTGPEHPANQYNKPRGPGDRKELPREAGRAMSQEMQEAMGMKRRGGRTKRADGGRLEKAAEERKRNFKEPQVVGTKPKGMSGKEWLKQGERDIDKNSRLTVTPEWRAAHQGQKSPFAQAEDAREALFAKTRAALEAPRRAERSTQAGSEGVEDPGGIWYGGGSRRGGRAHHAEGGRTKKDRPTNAQGRYLDIKPEPKDSSRGAWSAGDLADEINAAMGSRDEINTVMGRQGKGMKRGGKTAARGGRMTAGQQSGEGRLEQAGKR